MKYERIWKYWEEVTWVPEAGEHQCPHFDHTSSSSLEIYISWGEILARHVHPHCWWSSDLCIHLLPDCETVLIHQWGLVRDRGFHLAERGSAWLNSLNLQGRFIVLDPPELHRKFKASLSSIEITWFKTWTKENPNNTKMEAGDAAGCQHLSLSLQGPRSLHSSCPLKLEGDCSSQGSMYICTDPGS